MSQTAANAAHAANTARNVAPASSTSVGRIGGLVSRINALFASLPDALIALLGRFSIAAVFWKSGQTKIEGFAADFIAGEYSFGWPRLSDSAVALFQVCWTPWAVDVVHRGDAVLDVGPYAHLAGGSNEHGDVTGSRGRDIAWRVPAHRRLADPPSAPH